MLADLKMLDIGYNELAALTPEVWPCLAYCLTSGLHVAPLFATGFHCR